MSSRAPAGSASSSGEGGPEATAATMNAQGEIVRFVPFSSSAEPSFWMSLGDHKLNVSRLDEGPVSLAGSYGIAPPTTRGGGVTAAESRMRFDGDSIVEAAATSSPSADSASRSASSLRNETVRTAGSFVALNTVETFKKCDKNGALNGACLPPLLRALGVRDAGETEEEDPTPHLAPFFCLAHLDLKRHSYLYWFAFPALLPRTGRAVRYAPGKSGGGNGQTLLREAWDGGRRRELRRAFRRMRAEALERGSSCPGFFLAATKDGGVGGDEEVRCLSLSRKNYEGLSEADRGKCVFAFLDPTVTSASRGSPSLPVGWTMRNLVAYLTFQLGLGGKDVQILSYRPGLIRRLPSPGSVEEAKRPRPSDDDDKAADARDSSLMLHVRLPLAEDYDWSTTAGGAAPPSDEKVPMSPPAYRCTGWELNARRKPGPRSVDLSHLLSPARLATQATDLNLRLMKWRLLPALDLDRLSTMRVLLLGAGTLGCGVARTLQGWGVRRMTFVDNGRVSYSNPARQSLFTLEDCEGGGKYKAVAAADALRKIAGDDVEAEGVVLTIPMPGHPLSGEKEVSAALKDVERLHELMEASDAIFLLTDTRESRWLPTVMSRSMNKTLINAALGLDGWLVMRHGVNTDNRLGCYFCNDVVAPENSTRDRTLDQQCTVTRPGLAPVASAMAVELLVALLHHPLGADAPATQPLVGGKAATFSPGGPSSGDNGSASSPLGDVPHQIRGSLVSYTLMTPSVPAFGHCTGCSDEVAGLYRDRGFDFVQRCCDVDGPTYLEDVAGLTAFREEANAKLAEMEECDGWDDDEEESDDF